MSEIRDLMQARLARLETSGDSNVDVDAARTRVRRHRRTRAALTTTAAVAGAVVVAGGAWLGYGALQHEVAVTPSPSVSPSPTIKAEPSETPEPSPTPDPVEEYEEPTPVRPDADDATVLANLEAPTTGETWHAPQPIDDMGLYSADEDLRYYEVGQRGDATIVAVVASQFVHWYGGFEVVALVEVDNDGARLIMCPSARSTDSCLPKFRAEGQVTDIDTYYDTLTLPTVIEPVPGWQISTAGASGALGAANGFPGLEFQDEWEAEFVDYGTRSVVTAIGPGSLVEYRQPGTVPGTEGSRLVVETPFGSVVASSGTGGDWYQVGAVTWNDGTSTFRHTDGPEDVENWPLAPAAEVCFGPEETLIDTFVPSQWRSAGSHVMGPEVFLPVEGGNDLSRAVFDSMKEKSWSYDDDAGDIVRYYPYDSHSAFLDARSVFAWERPDGAWVVALDAYARHRVYECA